MSLVIDIEHAIKRQETRLKSIISSELCSYGIKPLDDALEGILRSELVVLGADSGVGKSHLANHIAFHNAKNGRKVCLISLEGDKDEVISRIKYQHITENYYRNEIYKHHGIKISYNKYVSNSIKDKVFDQLESQASEFIRGSVGNNLFLYNREVEDSTKAIDVIRMGIKKHFIKEPSEDNPFGIWEYRSQYDLFVIDHLHYFDNPDDENENKFTSKLMREIKNNTDTLSTPIVLVSHLRKKFRDRGMPDIEDLHGSSNIPKIASTVILISPVNEGCDYANMIYPTAMRIAKSRSGIKPGLCTVINFNGKTNSYEERYEVWKITATGKLEELDEEKWPIWAHGQRSMGV